MNLTAIGVGSVMNKIAVYLNEHLLGEVSSAKSVRERFSRDGSVLSIAPEIVIFPRVTNDIRKAARFAWQLAEKGHPMGITVRGKGGDVTGAAIGKGAVISMGTHLNRVINIAQKDRLVHVQPGVTFDVLNPALKWQSLSIPNAPSGSVTVGGALANNTLGENGAFADSIKKLEIVLANGDLIETARVSKRDLNKKLGLQTFEGEIYRKLEGLIEDNEELIQQLANDPVRDNAGYKDISLIKQKDGSFDLTPLFIGSQGTLGIISEVVLRAEFYSQYETVAVIVAETSSQAVDIVDNIVKVDPTVIETFDGELFRRAAAEGTKFNLLGSVENLGTVIVVKFNDFSDRVQGVKLKKLRKVAAKLNVAVIDSSEHAPEDFDVITNVGDSLRVISADNQTALPLIDGAYIPADRLDEFYNSVAELASKHHLTLPVRTNILTGTVYVYPVVKLDVVSEKQKLFRLLTDFAELVDRCNGAFVSDNGEGRLKANAAWSIMNEKEVALYEQVRSIFDPFGTLNPGVKEKGDLRAIVAALRSSHDVSDFVS